MTRVWSSLASSERYCSPDRSGSPFSILVFEFRSQDSRWCFFENFRDWRSSWRFRFTHKIYVFATPIALSLHPSSTPPCAAPMNGNAPKALHSILRKEVKRLMVLSFPPCRFTMMVCLRAIMFALLLSAVFAGVSAIPAPEMIQQEVPCSKNLNCNHDASCIRGVANFTVHLNIPVNNTLVNADFLATSQIDNQHCSCPIGWTGVTCEVKYESCDQHHPCFHGGQCILGLNDRFGNDQLFCNCDNAVDLDGNNYGTCVQKLTCVNRFLLCLKSRISLTKITINVFLV